MNGRPNWRDIYTVSAFITDGRGIDRRIFFCVCASKRGQRRLKICFYQDSPSLCPPSSFAFESGAASARVTPELSFKPLCFGVFLSPCGRRGIFFANRGRASPFFIGSAYRNILFLHLPFPRPWGEEESHGQFLSFPRRDRVKFHR